MGEGAAWRGAPNGAMGEGVAWRGAPPMSKQNGFVAAYRCYRSPQSPAQRACPNATLGGPFWSVSILYSIYSLSVTAFVSKPLGRWARLAFRGVDEFLINLFEMGDMEEEWWDSDGETLKGVGRSSDKSGIASGGGSLNKE